MPANLKFSELVSGKPVKVSLDNTDVCVVRVNDEVFAVSDTCSHAEASLSEGEVTEFKIECWLHGAEFDLRSGEAVTPPATAPLIQYQVSRDGDSVTINEPVR
ncbi:MAG: non-heme iron oxygenase ferredoxin subunit [Actinomycetales bacterium]|jgi:3-phenylpropionate/trans-cinnamate dioxygenase ferredoxin subunit